MAAIKALQQWCKIQCDGYRDVNIINMTTSFRDGLAFCALIHKHRPDLIDFDSLAKENIYDNNNLAFRVAEDRLGIPALLDAEDMVALRIPDRLSILTYVSQYYNYFNGRPPCGGVGGVKRPAEGWKEEPTGKKNLPIIAKPLPSKLNLENRPPLSKAITSLPAHLPKLPPTADKQTPSKEILVEQSNKSGTLSSICVVCKHHVHLVQRHLVDGRLYHRSCFKCCECFSALLPGAYKAGPEPGSYTCVSHHGPQKSSKMSASAGKSNPVPSLRPDSVLSAPIKIEAKPINPPPMATPWTASAQRTQAARKRFFLSLSATVDPTAPSERAPESTGPSKDSEENNRDKAGSLTEGNCNNNNISTSAGLRETASRSKRDITSHGSTETKPAKPIMCQETLRNKEMLWAKSIQRESLNSISSRLREVEKSETPADWRAMLKPVSNGQRLNLLIPPASPVAVMIDWLKVQPLPFSPILSSPKDRRDARNKVPHAGFVCCDSTQETQSSSINPPSTKPTLHKGRSFSIPEEQIEQELQEIAVHLSNLEKQGVEMEKRLRQCEADGDEDALDSLMVDWFNLIKTKQAYIRRESELVYIAKTQDLEEQQPGVEGELRRLMDIPEHLKTSVDWQREEVLMKKLMGIVNDRNAIVVVLDEDRLREAEEDQQLHQMMEKLGKQNEKSKKSPIKKLFSCKSKKDRMKN
ncbi:hypothetical protein GJAV_G00217510 [Gymnothorax javanicus]|nr:hypothetical protein GJAV_G00217510 [Gymnothorax javanicus]